MPVRPVQYADLDGDGEPELLAHLRGAMSRQQTLSAFSCQTGRMLWSATISAPYLLSSELNVLPDWPLVSDLDGDGRGEIVVSDFGARSPSAGYRGVRMLDGASGRSRWVRPLQPGTLPSDGLTNLIEAPDLDGDGTRDLITVSRLHGREPPVRSAPKPAESKRIYVDALSGKDGHPLWWWHVDIADERLTRISAPRWWGRGPDGWPLLAVAVGGLKNVPTGLGAERPDRTHVLEASSGREVHTIDGLTDPDVADLDGDGVIDLWGHGDRLLHAFRGEAPEIWRALGKYDRAGRAAGPTTQGVIEPAVDFDHDGIADALIGIFHAPSPESSEPTGSRTIVAHPGGLDERSGRRDSTLGHSGTIPRATKRMLTRLPRSRSATSTVMGRPTW